MSVASGFIQEINNVSEECSAIDKVSQSEREDELDKFFESDYEIDSEYVNYSSNIKEEEEDILNVSKRRKRMRLLTDSEDHSEENNEQENIEIAIDGTVSKKIDIGSSAGRPPLHTIFKAVSDPTGYAKKIIMKGKSDIDDPYTFDLHHDDRSTPPVTPVPPSTPRKLKGEQPCRKMTVTHNNKQPLIGTASPNLAMKSIKAVQPSSSGNSSGSDTDIIGNSASKTALRRLYFKSGRTAKNKTGGAAVPKVIVMGSSTTSTQETTINTSTESASTLITSVTATDTSEACDSLDMGDISGQSEPLLSSLDEPPNTSSSSNKSITELELLTTVMSGPDESLSSSIKEAESSLCHLPNKTPRTAPVISTTHFPFDPPISPKSVKITQKDQNLFTFKEVEVILEKQNKQNNKSLRKSDFQTDERIAMKNVDKRVSPTETRKGIQNFYELSVIKNVVEDKTSHFDTVQDNNMDLSETRKYRKDIKLKGKSYRNSNCIKRSPRKEKSVLLNNQINSNPNIFSKEKNYSYRKQNNSYKKVHTMFPFDREALDYERIQRECFSNTDDITQNSYDTSSASETSSSNEDISVCERKQHISPSKLNKTDVFQQYTLLTQQEHFTTKDKRLSKRNRPDLIYTKYDHPTQMDAFSPKIIDQTHTKNVIAEVHKFDEIVSKFDQIQPKDTIENLRNSKGSICQLNNNSKSTYSISGIGNNTTSRYTPPQSQSPDLRYDYFTESNNFYQQNKQSEILEDCQNTKQSQNAGAINVTPNPMETAVCTQPRATIVVQQPSLSLDNTVETLLLKSEEDFISVEQAKESRHKKQQREDNMRQLLDVTNALTFEELRDFEMRYGSPHHCRSQSVKTTGSRSSDRPNQLTLPQQRSRVASMPNTGVEEEYYRLRHFSITGKGVVNRGDSLKSRRSRSNNSVASSNSSNEHLTAIQVQIGGSARTSASCSLASSRESSTSNPGSGPFRVLMLGSSAVGKSSLVLQFMTSEYLHAYDMSIDDESGEKAVSVLLNGEESELIFIDHAYIEMSPENCLSTYEPHGYCVIYSSSDRGSFIVAERILQSLWRSENIAQKAVILVGNKADLVRSRVISSDEGKSMATAYDCKYIETSVGINHNVDELLVGLLSQIRLKLENPEKSRDLFRKRSCRKSKRRACSPLGVSATACLTGNGGTNPSTPTSQINNNNNTSELNGHSGSVQNSPRKYRGSRTSASLKVKGLLGRVWARDSKSKSCENLHVL